MKDLIKMIKNIQKILTKKKMTLLNNFNKAKILQQTSTKNQQINHNQLSEKDKKYIKYIIDGVKTIDKTQYAFFNGLNNQYKEYLYITKDGYTTRRTNQLFETKNKDYSKEILSIHQIFVDSLNKNKFYMSVLHL